MGGGEKALRDWAVPGVIQKRNAQQWSFGSAIVSSRVQLVRFGSPTAQASYFSGIFPIVHTVQ